MKLRIVHLLLLQSVMLLLSCSNQSRKNMDTSAEPADVQANVSDSSRIEQDAIGMTFMRLMLPVSCPLVKKLSHLGIQLSKSF